MRQDLGTSPVFNQTLQRIFQNPASDGSQGRFVKKRKARLCGHSDKKAPPQAGLHPHKALWSPPKCPAEAPFPVQARLPLWGSPSLSLPCLVTLWLARVLQGGLFPRSGGPEAMGQEFARPMTPLVRSVSSMWAQPGSHPGLRLC